MPRYLLECTIDPDRLGQLAAGRAEHYAFLVEHRGTIVFGGPARSADAGPPETMVIVVEVPTREAAEAFIAGEPYNRSGAFSAVVVRPWTQVLPEPEPGTLQRTLDAERRGP